jgi:hypothetical protein
MASSERLLASPFASGFAALPGEGDDCCAFSGGLVAFEDLGGSWFVAAGGFEEPQPVRRLVSNPSRKKRRMINHSMTAESCESKECF